MKTIRDSSICFAFIFLVPAGLSLIAQDTIYLINPSFEDFPRKGGAIWDPIEGWNDCSLSRFPGESPPDIHPVPTKAWGVTTNAFDGQTYLGLVTRYNGTYESVSQKLAKPLKADSCYSFSVMMSRDNNYKSPTIRSKGRTEDFTEPVLLQIWGAGYNCNYIELIGRSEPVEHHHWLKYKFIIWPKQDLEYISLEAYFNEHATEGYNGHILIDALSPIVMIPCK